MPSFNDILKKGKTAASSSTPEDKWKNHIINVLVSLQALNDMYGCPEKHKLVVEQISCAKCGKVSYALKLEHIDSSKGLFKYYLHEWASDDVTTFYCPDCKPKP